MRIVHASKARNSTFHCNGVAHTLQPVLSALNTLPRSLVPCHALARYAIIALRRYTLEECLISR